MFCTTSITIEGFSGLFVEVKYKSSFGIINSANFGIIISLISNFIVDIDYTQNVRNDYDILSSADILHHQNVGPT